MRKTCGLLLLSGSLLIGTANAGWAFPDYANSAPESLVRDGFGGCVKTGMWTEASARPAGCGDPVPVAAAPVAKPVPVPQPVLDSDGDGIIDSADRCPGTRAGVSVDGNGCEVIERISLDSQLFELNSAELAPSAQHALDAAAERIVANLDRIEAVAISGHTDNTGSEAYNLELSKRRAVAVSDYLAGRNVPAELMRTEGMGSSMPLADNSLAEGRSRNRRVEVDVKM